MNLAFSLNSLLSAVELEIATQITLLSEKPIGLSTLVHKFTNVFLWLRG